MIVALGISASVDQRDPTMPAPGAASVSRVTLLSELDRGNPRSTRYTDTRRTTFGPVMLTVFGAAFCNQSSAQYGQFAFAVA